MASMQYDVLASKPRTTDGQMQTRTTTTCFVVGSRLSMVCQARALAPLSFEMAGQAAPF
jgi:hypothetical protein